MATHQEDAIAHPVMRGVTVAFGLGSLFILASPLITSAVIKHFLQTIWPNHLWSNISISGYLPFQPGWQIWCFLADFTADSKCGLA